MHPVLARAAISLMSGTRSLSRENTFYVERTHSIYREHIHACGVGTCGCYLEVQCLLTTNLNLYFYPKPLLIKPLLTKPLLTKPLLSTINLNLPT